jgi:hypothetical protein
MTDLKALLAEYGVEGAEARRAEPMIRDALAVANEEVMPMADPEGWLSILPHSLPRVMVELIAPVADSPHAGFEIEGAIAALTALREELRKPRA